MGLGTITFSDREWVHLRWSGHVVGMGMRDTAEWPGRLEYMGRDPKEDPNRLGKILKERVMERSESYIARP
jgi:hypothetical protein